MRIIGCFGLAILLLACVRIEEKSLMPEFDKELTFKAYRETTAPDTKTERQASTDVYWTPGDEVSLFFRSGDNGGSCFVAQNTTTSAIAEFKGTITGFAGGGESSGGEYWFWGVYPYSVENSCNGSSIITVLPSEQTAKVGSFADNLFLTMARAKGLELAFYNICSGIKFTVSHNNIKTVSFCGNAGEDIAGKVCVEWDANIRPAIKEYINGKQEVTVTAPGGGTFVPETEYYIVFFPELLSSGFTLTFYTDDGKKGSFNYGNSRQFKRGIFVSAPTLDANITDWVQYLNVESVNLNKTELSLVVGKTETLVPTVTPVEASQLTVLWESSNPSVATVDQNGKVTAVTAGNATITANVGGKSAACSLTVINPPTSVVCSFPSVSFSCSSTVIKQTTNEWMDDNIYSSFGEASVFHSNYVFNNMNGQSGEFGIIEEVRRNNTDPDKTIRWTLTPDEIWSLSQNFGMPKLVKRHCTYTNGSNTITIELQVTVNPFNNTFDLDWDNNASSSDYIAQYWIAHWGQAQWEATAFHVATPISNGTDPNYCTFVNDLNAPFITHDGLLAGYPAGTLKVVRDGVYLNNIRYFFHTAMNKADNKTFVKSGEEVNKLEHVNIRISADGLTLYAFQGVLTSAQKATTTYEQLVASGLSAANIYPVAVIANNASIPWNTVTYQQNELAKALLNTDGFYAYIGATGDICTAPASVHPAYITFHGQPYFKVDFLRPIGLEAVSPSHFVDGVDFGDSGTYIRYEDIVYPYDWRLTWNGYDSHFTPNHANYWNYYGILGEVPGSSNFVIHADLANATCTLGGPGSSVPASIVLQANEINNTTAFALDSWSFLTAVNDEDWYTDLNGDNTKVYSYNRTAGYGFYSDVPAGKRSEYGYLTYYNSGSAIGSFNITVPMVIYYKWGKLRSAVTISVEETI